MFHKKTALAAALLAASLFAGVSAALAADATARTSVNVRGGPGTDYAVRDTLYAGEPVNVLECAANGWCRVEHDGPDGWVSSNYLVGDSGGHRSGRSGGGSSSSSSDPDVNFGFGIDSDGNFKFGFGINQDPPSRRPTHRTAEACFYDQAGFRGASFCADEGTRDRVLSGGWNNRISSVNLNRGASVTVCTQTNLRGFCRTLNSDASILGFALNNKISSYRVD